MVPACSFRKTNLRVAKPARVGGVIRCGMSAIPPLSVTPDTAWFPLPETSWTPEAAAHLLRRLGFTATPIAVHEAHRSGLTDTVQKAFFGTTPLPEPESLQGLRAEFADVLPTLRQASPKTRRQVIREFRSRQRGPWQDFAVAWTHHAAQPEHAATEKWVLFLQDVLVVSQRKVKNVAWLFDYQQALRSHCLGSYPALVKAVTRLSAMIRYLDLNQSSRRRPNENFARELFELFTLGEGNYTEGDIKEAARALTGYRIRFDGTFFLDPRYHDDRAKTIFGETARFDGDDVVDLIFEQPAAATFLPAEALRYYLSHDPLPQAYLETLGRFWREDGFSLHSLATRIFQSRLFFEPVFRESRLKSPVEFYLGLCQDLNIGTLPLAGPLLRAYSTMGQSFFEPPNVRGWVGGRHWFNSISLSARWSLIEQLFDKPNEARLDADELQRLERAREAGWPEFYINPDQIAAISGEDPEQIADRLMTHFFTGRQLPDYRARLVQFLRESTHAERTERLEAIALALLKSPAYQYC